eukprot:3485225-Rhodomonas_salina.2
MSEHSRSKSSRRNITMRSFSGSRWSTSIIASSATVSVLMACEVAREVCEVCVRERLEARLLLSAS